MIIPAPYVITSVINATFGTASFDIGFSTGGSGDDVGYGTFAPAIGTLNSDTLIDVDGFGTLQGFYSFASLDPIATRAFQVNFGDAGRAADALSAMQSEYTSVRATQGAETLTFDTADMITSSARVILNSNTAFSKSAGWTSALDGNTATVEWIA